ncbi:hypothetical protein KCP69_13735 [Salmonella enterica subsp. enterica]|nr:hypothetical protein KCP69_13735 [Salmonella enterica subsp. enterica]
MKPEDWSDYLPAFDSDGTYNADFTGCAGCSPHYDQQSSGGIARWRFQR